MSIFRNPFVIQLPLLVGDSLDVRLFVGADTRGVRGVVAVVVVRSARPVRVLQVALGAAEVPVQWKQETTRQATNLCSRQQGPDEWPHAGRIHQTIRLGNLQKRQWKRRLFGGWKKGPFLVITRLPFDLSNFCLVQHLRDDLKNNWTLSDQDGQLSGSRDKHSIQIWKPDLSANTRTRHKTMGHSRCQHFPPPPVFTVKSSSKDPTTTGTNILVVELGFEATANDTT